MRTEDYDGYSEYDLPQNQETIGTILVIENGYVIEKEYCLNCGSTDIKISKKGNKYCGKICWKK